MNYSMNRTDIKIFRNVRNAVNMYIKDVDRKPFALAHGGTIRIVDRKSETLLLSRPLTLIDAGKALYGVTIDASDCATWPNSFLEYTVTYSDEAGHDMFIFTDRSYAPYGMVQVLDGPLPNAVEPVVIAWSSFLQDNGFWFSGAQAGAATVGNSSGVSTLAAYCENDFTGNITVQGSIVVQPSTDGADWFDVTSLDLMESSSVVPLDCVGNYLWVRVKVAILDGNITQVLFKA